jgi:serine/threonine-protein kinase
MSQLPQFTQANPYPQEGEVLDGKYRVEKLLGEGGMGAVAKATHLIRRAPVALKFMSPAVLALQGAVERFVNEGVAASQIDSDHVVKVFDVGRLPSGAPYLVMEFLPGQDLAQILEREGGRLSIPRAVHFTIQILRALQTAHAAGIIHRDMKPSNCFVIDKDGEPDFVKLVDFGISKVRSDDPEGKPANLTRTNSALGTPLYMSPEQARSPRDVDQRSDLYSVGAILYELLAGRTPYTSDTGEFTEILYKIFTTEPEPLQNLRPDVPPELAAVVQRALTRDLNIRFATAVDFAEALAPFADERSANVISRLRGGRGRSIVPAPAAGALTPSRAPPVPNYGDAATANTFPGTPDMIRPAKVPTDIGVTRDAATTGAGTKAKKFPAVAGIAVVAVLALSAGTVVLVKRGASGQATQEPPTVVTTALPSAPPPPASTAPAVAIPSASLAPLATAAPTVSASAAAAPTGRPPSGNTTGNNAAGNNGATGSPPVPGNKPPSTLGGIGLH